MSIFDKAKDAFSSNQDKISGAVDQHGDKIDQGIDRGSQQINDRTGGRYEDQVTQGGDRLREGLDGLDGKNDDLRDGTQRDGEKPQAGEPNA